MADRLAEISPFLDFDQWNAEAEKVLLDILDKQEECHHLKLVKDVENISLIPGRLMAGQDLSIKWWVTRTKGDYCVILPTPRKLESFQEDCLYLPEGHWMEPIHPADLYRKTIKQVVKEYFEKVDKPSVKMLGGRERCVYRDGGNNLGCCVVGYLITDENYSSEIESVVLDWENEVMQAVEKSIGRALTSDEASFLIWAQDVHDRWSLVQNFRDSDIFKKFWRECEL